MIMTCHSEGRLCRHQHKRAASEVDTFVEMLLLTFHGTFQGLSKDWRKVTTGMSQLDDFMVNLTVFQST